MTLHYQKILGKMLRWLESWCQEEEDSPDELEQKN